MNNKKKEKLKHYVLPLFPIPISYAQKSCMLYYSLYKMDKTSWTYSSKSTGEASSVWPSRFLIQCVAWRPGHKGIMAGTIFRRLA